MPTRLAVGQAILNDEANGKFDHRIRVIGFRGCNVRGVDGKMVVTFAAVMFGIVQHDFDGTTGDGIAEVMELPFSQGVPGAEAVALGTPAFLADAGTAFELGERQIVGIDDSFGRVGNVGTGTRHAGILRD